MEPPPNSDLFGMIVTWLLVFFVIVFCLLWFIHPILRALWRWRNPPEKVAADKRAFEHRLLNPDWSLYERHLQRPTPPALREMFNDQELILSQNLDFSESETLAEFSPLDELGLVNTRSWLGFDAIAIATNLFGDPIYLRPGTAESDGVFVTYHDGGETEQLAPDVLTFLDLLRRAKREGRS